MKVILGICSTLMLTFAIEASSIKSVGFVGGLNYSQYNLDRSANSYPDFSREPQIGYSQSWQIGMQGESSINTVFSILGELSYQNIVLKISDMNSNTGSANGPFSTTNEYGYIALSVLGKFKTKRAFLPHLLFGCNNMLLISAYHKACASNPSDCRIEKNRFDDLNRFVFSGVIGIGKDICFNRFRLTGDARYLIGLSTVDDLSYAKMQNYMRFNSFQLLFSFGYLLN